MHSFQTHYAVVKVPLNFSPLGLESSIQIHHDEAEGWSRLSAGDLPRLVHHHVSPGCLWVSVDMEVSGLEPLTSCLQSRRSTN